MWALRQSLAEGRGVAAAFRAEGAGVGVAAVGMRKDSHVGVGISENQLTKLVLGNIEKRQSDPPAGRWVSKN